MKKALSYLTIFSLLFGCAPAPYITTINTVYKSPSNSPNEFEEIYYNKIADNLYKCYTNNDHLLEFWQYAVICAFDPYIILDSDTMSFLEDKAKEYNNEYIVECKQVLKNAINKIGEIPNNNNFILLRYELWLTSITNSINNNISNQSFKELEKKREDFFEPIYKKISFKSEENQNKMIHIAKIDSDGASIPFGDVYVNILKYSEQEKKKLEKLIDIYNKLYNKDVFKIEAEKFRSKLNNRQKERLNKLIFLQDSKANKEDIKKANKEYIQLLNNEQILIWDKLLASLKYSILLNEIINERLDKYKVATEWLKENKIKAAESINRQDTIRAEQAKAINSALLIGLGVGLSAYGDYLSRPRAQTTILQPNLSEPYKGNAYGPGINSDATGRPFTWQTQTPKGRPRVFDPTLNVRPDVYGPGVGSDQYGRPVTKKPWP